MKWENRLRFALFDVQDILLRSHVYFYSNYYFHLNNTTHLKQTGQRNEQNSQIVQFCNFLLMGTIDVLSINLRYVDKFGHLTLRISFKLIKHFRTLRSK